LGRPQIFAGKTDLCRFVEIGEWNTFIAGMVIRIRYVAVGRMGENKKLAYLAKI